MRPCPQCQEHQCQIRYTAGELNVVKCSGCGLVYLANPPDTRELYEDYYQDAPYAPGDYHAHSSYDNLAKLYVINRERMRWIQKERTGGRLLDVGCGSGFFLKTAQESGFDVQGIDVSENAVTFAQNRMGLNASLSTLDDLLAAGQRFDVITLWHVLEHFLDPFIVLEKVEALLEEGGVCFIEVPNLHSLKFTLSKTKWQGGNHPRYHRTFFTRRTLRQALKKCGFTRIGRIRPVYCHPGQPPGYGMVKKILNRFSMDAFLDFKVEKA